MKVACDTLNFYWMRPGLYCPVRLQDMWTSVSADWINWYLCLAIVILSFVFVCFLPSFSKPSGGIFSYGLFFIWSKFSHGTISAEPFNVFSLLFVWVFLRIFWKKIPKAVCTKVRKVFISKLHRSRLLKNYSNTANFKNTCEEHPLRQWICFFVIQSLSQIKWKIKIIQQQIRAKQ